MLGSIQASDSGNEKSTTNTGGPKWTRLESLTMEML